MTTIRISESLSLPIDAVTQTFGIVARKGAGKTYLAGVIAEQMIDARAQVVIIDPVGNWWGLRVAADGVSKGKDIFVIGGRHGDLPLVPEAGAKIADVLVSKQISAVIDVSRFRKNERKRFAADFAEEFFQLKKDQPSAVHLFIEEAQLFVPQRSGPDEARMLGAFEDIVRVGRNYGIGCSLISQRPQSVNKEVLSQVECLIALQVNGVHERKALDEWVQEAGADRKLVNELPGLSRGEGYVWSPAWLRIFKKVRFVQKTTFDASATPEAGRAAKTAKLVAVDVDALRADLEEVVAKAERDDPKALKRRITELERQLKAAPTAAATPMVPDPDAVRRLVMSEISAAFQTMRETLGKELADKLTFYAEQARAQFEYLEGFAGVLRSKDNWDAKALTLQGETALKKIAMVPAKIIRESPPCQDFSPRTVAAKRTTAPANQNGADLAGPERRILNAIAWMEAIGVPQPEQPAVAFLAGYTYGGGAFNNPRGRLNQRGLVRYVGSNQIELTDAGRQLAEFPEMIGSDVELHQAILSRLPGPEQRLLTPLLKHWPKPMTNEQLAQAANYTAGAGAFNNPRGRLRSLGLIEYPQAGMVRARDILFPTGR